MNETAPVRDGEELDIDRLTTYLTEHIGVAFDELEVEQFPAGSSNLTYLVRLGRIEYVLRRPPFGNTVATAHDMRREFDVLNKLSAVYAPAPKPVVFCGDESVIGSEFYLMERREGLIIRGKIPGTHAGHSDETLDVADPGTHPPELVGPGEGTPPATDVHFPPSAPVGTRDLSNSQGARVAVCQAFMQNLADLHRLDHKAAGLESLGRIDGYNLRQVDGWSKRYEGARTHSWPHLDAAIEWLLENTPPETGASLVHNDYKFDNIMLAPDDLTRVTAVLDWEMVTVGDPLMDLGTTLGYWMSPDAGDEMLEMPFNPRTLMENITRTDLVEMYAESLGRNVPDMLFYYVFGTFKIAVIAQQIYARFARGNTTDSRFAQFDKFVGNLGRIANNAINRESI